MATRFPEPIPVPLVDPVATKINQSIDRLILSLEQRRAHLLTVLRDTREQMRHNQVALQQMEEELIATQRSLEGQMKHNMLLSMQKRMLAELEAKRVELRANLPPPQDVRFLCDTQNLEEHIARLGEIVCPGRPDYAAFQQPIVAVGKHGSAPGEFKWPRGVSIELKSGQIYVADKGNSRIQVFSQTGDYLKQFGHQHLVRPYGILIHLNNIYVTDIHRHAIFQFKLPDLTMIKQVGKIGSGKEEFDNPKQLAISPNQRLYVADKLNNRIQILSTNLAFQGSLQQQIMTGPVDVKFSNNELFVLSSVEDPCIQVFSLSGEKSRDIAMQVNKAFFFCFDGDNNIVISDFSAHNIKVFSPKGDLLYTIGQEGDQAGMFTYPAGIAIIDKKLICLSGNSNFGLQIYFA